MWERTSVIFTLWDKNKHFFSVKSMKNRLMQKQFNIFVKLTGKIQFCCFMQNFVNWQKKTHFSLLISMKYQRFGFLCFIVKVLHNQIWFDLAENSKGNFIAIVYLVNITFRIRNFFSNVTVSRFQFCKFFLSIEYSFQLQICTPFAKYVGDPSFTTELGSTYIGNSS